MTNEKELPVSPYLGHHFCRRERATLSTSCSRGFSVIFCEKCQAQISVTSSQILKSTRRRAESSSMNISVTSKIKNTFIVLLLRDTCIGNLQPWCMARVKIDAINVSRFESHIESPHRTILYAHAWKPYDSRGVGNFTRREMSEKNIIQLMRTARQRAQMETGMYRPFLPYFCMLELHNFYIILH